MAINYPSGHLKFQVAIKNRQFFEERLIYRLTKYHIFEGVRQVLTRLRVMVL